jgi:hypothetical protein
LITACGAPAQAISAVIGGMRLPNSSSGRLSNTM